MCKTRPESRGRAHHNPPDFSQAVAGLVSVEMSPVSLPKNIYYYPLIGDLSREQAVTSPHSQYGQCFPQLDGYFPQKNSIRPVFPPLLSTRSVEESACNQTCPFKILCKIKENIRRELCFYRASLAFSFISKRADSRENVPATASFSRICSPSNVMDRKSPSPEMP